MKIFFNTLTLLLLSLVMVGTIQAQEGGNYRIKPTDVLHIYVHGNDDLTMNATVLPDGTISYPLVGTLYVQGLTTDGLQAILTEKLKTYLQEPVVAITITSTTSYDIYILGEVRNPGVIQYEEGKRLTDYLAAASGATPFADLKKCRIYPSKAGDPFRTVNVQEEILEKGNHELNILLQPYDTVIVPRRSGFAIVEWTQVSQVFSIIVGAATLYFIIDRGGR
ncbi:MAG: polysaccharide export protein [bacterium]|nr:polysaccharide export protein [bacterium]